MRKMAATAHIGAHLARLWQGWLCVWHLAARLRGDPSLCGFVALLVAAEEGPQAPPSGLQEFLGHPLMVPQRGNIN